MNRLTKRLEDGQAIMDCESCELKNRYCTAQGCRNRLKDRLAQYEDADFTSDEGKIVHCRECKYAYYRACEFDEEKVKRYCTKPFGMRLIFDDSFCSYGKRLT